MNKTVASCLLVLLAVLCAVCLSSCAAVQANPGVAAINAGIDEIAARAPDEAVKAAEYAAQREEQAQHAGRRIAVAPFCGRGCGASARASGIERDILAQDFDVYLGEEFCAKSCGKAVGAEEIVIIPIARPQQ